MYELGKSFYFDAAHTLNREIEAESSRRVHGHTYRVEVTVAGARDPATGMVFDLGLFDEAVNHIRALLDHRLLNEVKGLAVPTVETICAFIFRQLQPRLPGLSRITLRRDSTADWCSYDGKD